MIELAPRHKYGLPLAIPLMPATGTFGFGDAYTDLVDLANLGAIVTNPVSLRPRRAARGQRLSARGAHIVVHTGRPNPGLRNVVRQHGDTWVRLAVPVIVHLLATQPDEVGQAALTLSGVRGVGGLELGYAAGVSTTGAIDMLEAAREGDLPVIVQIPFDRVADLAPTLVNYGADAVTLTAPPRAAVLLDQEPGAGVARYMRGRLYGPALLPLLLNTLSRWTTKLAVPVIASGGIASTEDVLACLTLGAAAVQVDAVLWRDPDLLNRIGRALTKPLPGIDRDATAADSTGSETTDPDAQIDTETNQQ